MNLRATFSSILLTLSVIGCVSPSNEVVSESEKHVSAWSSTLIERSHGPANSDAILIDLILANAQGDLKVLANDLVGPFITLEKSERIFACEENSVMGAKAPLFVGLDGGIVEVASHPGYLRECQRISGTEHILLQYSLMNGERPYSLVRVVEPSGRVILERTFESAGGIAVEIEGVNRALNIPTPELPW